jgi:formate dehydrogenase subunit gamma
VSTSRVVSPGQAASNPEDRVLRYTLGERVTHWIAGLSYVYCLVTGLAFWSPYMFWLAVLVGGGPTARFWHPWLGLIFTLSVCWMFKIWRQDMRINAADLAWKKAMPHYIRNEDEDLPPIWRFNYGQKLFFWLMLYGGILLVLSGLGLWFVESIPWNLHWLRDLSVAVHVTAALATIGGFIIHVYMGTAMVRGGFTSIIRGEVSTAWAKTHHRLWYDRLLQHPPAKK